MEKVAQSLFKDLPFPSECERFLKGKILYVVKWNWDYENCLAFQKSSQELIRKHRDHKVYIFCNHSHCFTLGRGNERDRDDLLEFDEALMAKLSLPVYKIHRGGGLTFHFPGQWIFYPIVNISKNYSLENHMCWLLTSVKEVLRDEFGLTKAMATKKLLGVWLERKKLASIGVGLNRFVTEHGIALNLIDDKKMFQELLKVSPCGMDSQTYMPVAHVIGPRDNLLEEFHQSFLTLLELN